MPDDDSLDELLSLLAQCHARQAPQSAALDALLARLDEAARELSDADLQWLAAAAAPPPPPNDTP